MVDPNRTRPKIKSDGRVEDDATDIITARYKQAHFAVTLTFTYCMNNLECICKVIVYLDTE